MGIIKRQTLQTPNQPTVSDYVGIESKADIANLKGAELEAKPSDYARVCCKNLKEKYNGHTISEFYYLRDGSTSWKDIVCMGKATGTSAQVEPIVADSKSPLLCPTLAIDLDELKNNNPLGNFKITALANGMKTITFEKLVFPQTAVPMQLTQELTSLLHNEALLETYRQYLNGYVLNTTLFNEEFEHKGEKYVYSTVHDKDAFKNISSVTNPNYILGDIAWFKVEPIRWIIRNFDSLPKWLNPNGDGTAEALLLRSEKGLVSGIPFSLSKSKDYDNFYQNSFIRAYLNSYDLKKEITQNNNGNIDCYNGLEYDFDAGGTEGFLAEAYTGMELSELFKNDTTQSSNGKVEEVQIEVEKKKPTPAKKKKSFDVKIDNTPLSVSEQLKFYLNTGKAFMLHGPSGVGKTRRIQELDPQCVMLQLRNGILPEEIIGKTAFEGKSSVWIEPTWYTRLKQICEADPSHNHILFIDELTNVHANEQSLVYHIVLEHSIDGNIGALPKNCVVVAAGNNPEESEAAYNMPEPLFRRFDAHIQLKPDIESWIEWGSKPSDKGRPKIHPLIASFVAAYGNKVFYSNYDPENPPKFAVDPRAWEQVSNIIYDNNNVLRMKLIEDKVGTDIATALISFASEYHLTIDDIVKNNFDEEDIPTTESEKFALTCTLRKATEKQLPAVRKFIEKHFGGEKLATFDRLWVEDNDERALFLNELLENEQNGDSDESAPPQTI